MNYECIVNVVDQGNSVAYGINSDDVETILEIDQFETLFDIVTDGVQIIGEPEINLTLEVPDVEDAMEGAVALKQFQTRTLDWLIELSATTA